MARKKIDTNLYTSVQIFLAIHAIAALVKRLFSKLKLRNNDLRTRMSKAILAALGRLSTESGLCKNNDFGQVIQTLHANSYKNITPEKKGNLLVGWLPVLFTQPIHNLWQ